jgi:HSP20 family protein
MFSDSFFVNNDLLGKIVNDVSRDLVQEMLNYNTQSKVVPDTKKTGVKVVFPYDLVQRQDRYDLYVELPGYTRENIVLSLTNNTICIKAEKHNSNADCTIVSHRVYGSVQATIDLPNDIDTESITASYNGGVLCVSLNKKVVGDKIKNIPIR